MARFYDSNSNMKDMNIFTEDMSKPACVPTGDFVKIVKDPNNGLNQTYECGIGKIDSQISRDNSFVRKNISKSKE
jgi:hypothetical protein